MAQVDHGIRRTLELYQIGNRPVVSRERPTPKNPDPESGIGFLKWLLGDRQAALLGLAYIMVALGFSLALASIIAPHLEDVATIVLGAGAATGSVGIASRVISGSRDKSQRVNDSQE